MTYGDFVSGPDAQQRYWARSHLGWSRMKRAEPNDGHRALAALEAAGRLTDADHPERRRAARGRRVPRGVRAARPDRRRGLPRLPSPDQPRVAAPAARRG